MQPSHLESYLAIPDPAASSGEGPGVLVLHAWWGLSDNIRNVYDRLAEVVFVPDII